MILCRRFRMAQRRRKELSSASNAPLRVQALYMCVPRVASLQYEKPLCH
jgi:hypothetical protein